MLRSLEQQGSIGVTAIGDSPYQAHGIYLGAAQPLDQLAACFAVAKQASEEADSARLVLVLSEPPAS